MSYNKIAIGVILYYPKANALNRINWALNNGYRLYIYDNSPDFNLRLLLKDNEYNIKYFTMGTNSGIGTALRLMCATAFYEGFSYFLYFDQDTVYSTKTLEFIQEVIADTNKDNIFNNALSITFRDKILRNDSIQEFIVNGHKASRVSYTINSGTVFILDMLKKIGWHDSTFFIDGVDYSICLSAAKNKMKIIEVYETPGLDHKSEQEDMTYRIGCFSFRGREYPFYRRKDYMVSSIRLIIKAIKIDLKLSIWIINKLIAFYGKQLLIVFAKAISNIKFN